jgi:predicted ArsR family transcriptional regulator
MAARKARNETEAVVYALTHWLRREVLRCLQLPEVAVSAVMLEEAIGVPLNNCNYHLAALEKAGLAEEIHSTPIRGTTEHFYATKVGDNRIVQMTLIQTAEQDRKTVKAYQVKRDKRRAIEAAKNNAAERIEA